MTDNLQPVLKWVGGKRQLLGEILPLIPEHDRYFEPFIGGAAVAFALQPRAAVLTDANAELMNVYKVIRDYPYTLIDKLKQQVNTPEHYYRVRELDRDPIVYNRLDMAERAARIIYLNKAGCNGLFRVNSKGQINTPFGKYKNPNFANEDRIMAAHQFLSGCDIELGIGDFSAILERLDNRSFVYLDPPYYTESNGNFTAYTGCKFDKGDHDRLMAFCQDVDHLGAKFLLSNSDTLYIRGLYSGCNVKTVQARRNVNSKASGRGAVNELLISNY